MRKKRARQNDETDLGAAEAAVMFRKAFGLLRAEYSHGK